MTLANFLTIMGGCIVALLVLWFPLRLLVDQAGRELGNALSMQNLALRQRVLELERGHAAFNAALDFALDNVSTIECSFFLSEWREGNWSEWPEFKGPFPYSEQGPDVTDCGHTEHHSWCGFCEARVK